MASSASLLTGFIAPCGEQRSHERRNGQAEISVEAAAVPV